MTRPGQIIICGACGQKTAARSVKRYDGLRLTGETLACAFCGAELSGEEETPGEEETLKNLKAGGPPRFCRRCRHYVVNPFVQKCVLDNREVKASDSCGRFSPRPRRNDKETPPAGGADNAGWPFSS